MRVTGAGRSGEGDEEVSEEQMEDGKGEKRGRLNEMILSTLLMQELTRIFTLSFLSLVNSGTLPNSVHLLLMQELTNIFTLSSLTLVNSVTI